MANAIYGLGIKRTSEKIELFCDGCSSRVIMGRVELLAFVFFADFIEVLQRIHELHGEVRRDRSHAGKQ